LLSQNAGNLNAGTLTRCENTNDAERPAVDAALRQVLRGRPRVGERDERACHGLVTGSEGARRANRQQKYVCRGANATGQCSRGAACVASLSYAVSAG